MNELEYEEDSASLWTEDDTSSYWTDDFSFSKISKEILSFVNDVRELKKLTDDLYKNGENSKAFSQKRVFLKNKFLLDSKKENAKEKLQDILRLIELSLKGEKNRSKREEINKVHETLNEKFDNFLEESREKEKTFFSHVNSKVRKKSKKSEASVEHSKIEDVEKEEEEQNDEILETEQEELSKKSEEKKTGMNKSLFFGVVMLLLMM